MTVAGYVLEEDLTSYNVFDLPEILNLQAVNEQAEWVDRMIARFFSRPDERAAFLRGQRRVREEAASAKLPEALTQRLVCP